MLRSRLRSRLRGGLSGGVSSDGFFADDAYENQRYSDNSYLNDYSSEGGTLFHPSQISGLFAWYDASDVTTISSVGSNVVQWRDKSGNSRHLNQATAASQPSNGALVNGMNAIQFGAHQMDIPSSMYGLTNGAYTVVMIVKSDAVIAASTQKVMFTMGNAGTGRAQTFYNLGATRNLTHRAGSSPVNAQYTTNTNVNVKALVFGKSTNTAFIQEGRNAQVTQSGAANFTATTGAVGAVSTPPNAKYCEILIYNTLLSASQITQLLDYCERWTEPVMGLVGTRPLMLSGFDSTKTALNARRYHYARKDIENDHVLEISGFGVAALSGGGFGIQNGAETGPGANMTVSASIEYPAGVFTQAKFGGLATGTVPNGGLITSDPVPLSIPNGSKYYTRYHIECSAGILFYTTAGNGAGRDVPGGDNFHSGTIGSLSDNTMGGSYTDDVSTDRAYGAVALGGLTSQVSPYLLGDSRFAGLFDTPSDDMGVGSRAVGPLYGYINGGVSSDRAVWFITSYLQRLTLIQKYCRSVILELGTNDIVAGGRTGSQALADRTTIRSILKDYNLYDTTIEPRSSSSDNFTTVGSQTTNASNPDRNIINAGVRGLPKYFELAYLIESAPNSGLWNADGVTPNLYTVDGVHHSPFGSQIASGGINPSLLS